MRKRLILLVFSCCLAMTTMPSQAQVKNPTYKLMLKFMYKNTVDLITVEELNKQGTDQFILLDAREKEEYKTSHIEDAVWIGYDDFNKKRVADIDKSKAVVVYCSVGYRSERIGEQLKELGFEKVQNLYGGMFEWMNQEQEALDQENKPTKAIHAFSKAWGIWIDKGVAKKVYK